MGQATGRRAGAGRKQFNWRDLFTNPLFAVGLVLAVVLGFVLIRNAITAESDYYCQGVYINSVDMSVYTRDEGENMLNEWAKGLINRSYRLVYEGREYTFRPSDVGARINTQAVLDKAWNLGHTGNASDRSEVMLSLRYSPQHLWTEFTYDAELLDEFIAKIAQDVYVAPVDADILLTATKPVILSESTEGLALNERALKDTLIALMQSGGAEEHKLPVEVKEPAVSSNAAEDGLQLLVTYSTSLEQSSSPRRGNVRLALNNFNGFEVKIGETVSFNEIVGERTVLRGYVEAPVYYGASVTKGVGGGVCQASSTLYGALLYAGLDFIERHNHTLVVDYCAASMDAAVSEDASQDFVFENNTESTLYLYVNVNSEEATVMVYGSKPEYRIDLISTITQNDIKNPNMKTVKDPTGLYAYYTDDYTLKSKGKLGRRSMLERVYYDWVTGEEVKRETMSEDYYMGERDTYYVGIHPVGSGEI